MTTKDEALKLALEALQFGLHVGFEEFSESQSKKCEKAFDQNNKAITAIKQALAEPTVQEPVPPDDESICEDWISASDSDGVAYDGPSFERGYKLGQIAERDAERPQPEIRGVRSEFEAMFATPPAAQRQWVGLTVAEMEELTLLVGRMDYTRMLQLAEDKLKEKNT